jgi:general nucleoside transport system permease protein
MDLGVIFIILTAATPLLFAALGELVVERSGVLNLGVEGMMVMGAVCGFGAALYSGSPWIGLLAAIAAGMAMSLLFGFLTLTLVSNQVATGLALTLLGLGLSGQIGEAFVGQPGVKLPSIGGIDPLIPFAVVLTAAVSYFLFRTRWGLVVRAVGDSHASAHALGYGVIKVRYACVLFGGACSGLAGGYLSLVYTPQWIENMTSGRGWIALALVVFASWMPWRLLRAGGGLSLARLHATMDREHDLRAGLDRAGAGRLCLLAPLAGPARGLSFRHHFDPVLRGPNKRLGNSLPVLVFSALPRHHCGSRDHLRQPDDDEEEHAGLTGPALRA